MSGPQTDIAEALPDRASDHWMSPHRDVYSANDGCIAVTLVCGRLTGKEDEKRTFAWIDPPRLTRYASAFLISRIRIRKVVTSSQRRKSCRSQDHSSRLVQTSWDQRRPTLYI